MRKADPLSLRLPLLLYSILRKRKSVTSSAEELNRDVLFNNYDRRNLVSRFDFMVASRLQEECRLQNSRWW